jgi:putative transposase
MYHGLLRQGKSMRFAFIDVEKASYPVRVLCRVLQVSRCGYYAWKNRAPSARDVEDERLRPRVAAAFKVGRGTYGSPRVRDELVDQGLVVGRKRVARLMREQGLQGVTPRRFRRTTDSDHDHAIAKNLINRDFTANKPNQKWVTDITYIWTAEGWLYLAIVLDLFSRRIVGWSVADHMKTELCLEALEKATRQRTMVKGLVHHSDRGVQYASERYRDALAAQGIKCSMSRRADCWDNAVAESFFGTLKNELIHRYPWLTRNDARSAISEYIEIFYNRVRRHSAIGSMSPAKFEEEAQARRAIAS